MHSFMILVLYPECSITLFLFVSFHLDSILNGDNLQTTSNDHVIDFCEELLLQLLAYAP